MKHLLCRLLLQVQDFFFVPTPTVTILGYHAVSHDKTLIDITPKAFKYQIKYLKSHGYDFITLQEAVDFAMGQREITRPSVVLTFDDGYEDLLELAAPFLAKNNIPATYFVVTAPREVNRGEIENGKPLLTNRGLKKLANIEGSDLQGHTTKHIDVTKYSVSYLVNDFAVFDQDLASQGLTKATFFAYPWGRYNTRVIKALRKSGYQAAVTTEPGFVNPGQNPFLLPRIMIDQTHTDTIFPFLLTPAYPYAMKLLKHLKAFVQYLEQPLHIIIPSKA